MKFKTNNGEITGVNQFTLYGNGNLKECAPEASNCLDLPIGMLIPQFEYSEVRRKQAPSLTFYESGMLRRIALNHQTEVTTSVGSISAELITFYESGSIRRVFPLNGQLTAYWEENEEYALAKSRSFEFPFGKFETKVIALHFYEDEKVKGLTLWPQEEINVITPFGEQKVRIGITLYPDGSIQSFEPANPIELTTPIGTITAYDENADGITGDQNSLNITQEGMIKSLITSGTKVTIWENDKKIRIYSPKAFYDMDGLEINFLPLMIEFDNERVCLDGDWYDQKAYRFTAEPYIRDRSKLCTDCSACQGCHE